MLRRLIAAVLVAIMAVPLTALAGTGCQMDTPMLAAERCACCTAPMAAGPTSCSTAAMSQSGCGCALRADSGSQPASPAADRPPSANFAVDATLLAAAVSTPPRLSRALHLAASPPGARVAVSQSLLCTWIL
jgi:hypothetical protein